MLTGNLYIVICYTTEINYKSTSNSVRCGNYKFRFTYPDP